MKVSIIIPAFNRKHLIGETLDSIIAQTYINWECLIIDDGSTDNSLEVYQKYKEKDKRFLFFDRPDTKPKGANACRNIGLEQAQGEYVVFFDSDDLMTVKHLEVKVNAIQNSNYDYVITKTQYFNFSNDGINRYYQFDKFPITPFNYVSQNINWLTYDICLKIEIAQSIHFNENLQSGQEYNYFCKLVHISTKGGFIDEAVTLRRRHDNSIRSQLKNDKDLNQGYFNANWHTYLDLNTVADSPVLECLMSKCVMLCYTMKVIPISNKILFMREVFNVYGLNGVNFILMLVSMSCFNKGYWFRQKLLNN